jgi:hypothetical protein
MEVQADDRWAGTWEECDTRKRNARTLVAALGSRESKAKEWAAQLVRTLKQASSYS